MSNETNNIDQLFKSKLRDYSVEAPEHVWKGIEASRTPLHRAINYFKSKRGAALGSFIALATISSIAFFIMGDSEQLSQQDTTAYSLQKYNTPASVHAANYTDAAGLLTNNSSATTQNQLVNTTSNVNTNTTENTSATNNVANSNTESIEVDINTPKPTTTKDSKNNGGLVGGDDKESTKNNNSSTTDKETLLTTDTKNSDNSNKQVEEATEAPITNKDEVLTAYATDTDKAEEANKNNKVTVKPKNLISKWSVDVYAGGNYAMRSLTANGVNNDYFEAKKGAESYLPGYNFGVRLNYEVSPFLTVRSGVNYSKLSQRLNLERDYEYTKIETVTGVILDPVTQQPIGTTTRTDTNTYTETARANTTNTISFIDVPVQLELNIYKTPKYSIFATTGASLNLRFTQQGHQINQRLTGVDELTANNNPFRTTAGMSVLGGIGFKYNLNSNFSLLAESTYQHGVTNVMKNEAGMNQSYRIINATVGLRYRF